MNGKIKFNDVIDMYEKLTMDIDKTPYGFICSENVEKSLKEYCKEISNQTAQDLKAASDSLIGLMASGLKIKTIKYFPDDTIWLLNKINFEDVEKNGLASLIKKIAILNNMKFWGLND